MKKNSTKARQNNKGQPTSESSPHWSQIQESGAVLGIKLMFFIYRYLGRWLFSLLLYPVMVYFFLLKNTARRASMEYLQKVRALGAIPAGANLWWWSFKHFLQFGSSLADKLAAWSGALGRDKVVFHQREGLIALVEQGRGALVIVSHLGNQEVCRALATGTYQVKLNVLVHTRHAEKFNQVMNEIDHENRLNLLQVTEFTPATAMLMQEKLAAGEVVVIAGDRTPVTGERRMAANFLGAQAYFPQGPYILASVLKCPVYLMFCIKQQRQYQVIFEPFADSIRLARKNREQDLRFWVQKFADRLTDHTLRAPLQWSNFYSFWHDDSSSSP